MSGSAPVFPLAGAVEIRGAARRIELWLRDVAFPFWADVGLDTAGPGFVEHLTLDGRPADVPYKRVRVQARQVYCFCQASELGLHPQALAVAQHGIDLLVGSAWLGPGQGWASTLTRSGDPLSRVPDLYDMAFVLFALGWWHRRTGDLHVVRLAHETLDFLGDHMRHPSGRGYRHSPGASAPFLQNPHMHLAEAMIALRDATGSARFADEADELVSLCLDRFIDAESGTLTEELDASWMCDPDRLAARIEPGHHFEWVWLLHGYLGSSRSDPAVEAAMGRLAAFAHRFGEAEGSGLVYDMVLRDGRSVSPGHRLWPQAERLKALAAMAERFGDDVGAAVADGVDRIFRHYLETQPAGTWIEHRTALLDPRGDKIPASSFYHVVLAFAEVLRLAGVPAEAA